MKPLSEQDHYEILETTRAATAADIERAYRLAISTYSDDSLAGYSLLDDGDTTAMRERIEIAYRVLEQQNTRRAYDASLDGGPEVTESEVALPAESPAEPIGNDVLEGFDDESVVFDGGRLRRTRLRRGVELEQIAGVTKISSRYLNCLEEDRFDELPAPVYVRGFVDAYASCIGLDGKSVAASYMKHLETCRAEPGKKRELAAKVRRL